ncbi:MAG TPA: SDR family oxidoreductase [Candidatus Polarisedimenticolia bacterium]|nr:SDR family oxidoreductase [Candidatus Polarisedimenticolia bacterium]
MAQLDGRVAIVTGGAQGIGRHYALGLAAEGARVAIGDVADSAPAVGEVNKKHGPQTCAGFPLDVSDEASIKSFVGRVVERFGRIDILVNNAALCAALHPIPTTEMDVALWDRVMAVNARGPFLMAKHVIPQMKSQGYGKIINISTGMAMRGVPGMLHYVASKGAVLSITRCLSREVGPFGIRVNTIAPGLTLSDTVVATQPQFLEAVRAPTNKTRAIQRDEMPEDLVGTVVFLASPGSDFITGQTIIVDGGSLNS